MAFPKTPNHLQLYKKIAIFLSVFFLLQFMLGAFFIYQNVSSETTNQLSSITKRVKEDISFQNDKWDTKRYNADPELPGTDSLYVLATDGFVIDRWKPIHGFLDTSDAKKLLSYQTPQTMSADTDQVWQMLSKPIISGNQQVGVLTVAYYNPPTNNITSINDQLEQNANIILSKIQVDKGIISAKDLDFRDISYLVAFQVVDQYNKILIKSNNTNSIDRIPNFIDTSYVGNILESKTTQRVKDSVSGETYLVYRDPILGSHSQVIGVAVAAKSISYLYTILRDYLISEIILGIILILGGFFFLTSVIEKFSKKISLSFIQKPEIQHIAFDKVQGVISLDKHSIPIPYATNQFYLCKALFSNPKKRWEVDELLELFGDTQTTHWRKVYDTMNMINKKTSAFLDENLITVKDKTYQINPLLLPKLT